MDETAEDDSGEEDEEEEEGEEEDSEEESPKKNGKAKVHLFFVELHTYFVKYVFFWKMQPQIQCKFKFITFDPSMRVLEEAPKLLSKFVHICNKDLSTLVPLLWKLLTFTDYSF